MHYVTLWENLQLVSALEKVAEQDLDGKGAEAQESLALLCDQLFGAVKQASASPEALTQLVFSLRDAHRLTGEKLAASPDVTAELLQNLATASFVDDVLQEQLEKASSDDEYASVRSVQLLGREYAINLMRGLLA